MTSALPRFLPWVGDDYSSSPLRILVLGESHWAEPHDDVPSLTQDFVRHYALTVRFAFTTKVARLIGRIDPGTWLSDDLRSQFWQSIAFYNYVQYIVASSARVAPASEHWTKSAAAFLSVLEQLKPRIVFALGQRLWAGLVPALGLKEATAPVLHAYAPSGGISIPLVQLTHPSGRGFRYPEQQERVRLGLELTAPRSL